MSAREGQETVQRGVVCGTADAPDSGCGVHFVQQVVIAELQDDTLHSKKITGMSWFLDTAVTKSTM